MYALSSPRTMNSATRPSTATLILVPNPELAVQYYYWIVQVLRTTGRFKNNIEKVVQAFFRTDDEAERKQEERLKEFHPHIVIATPTRMLDILVTNADAFDVLHLRTIIADEMDHVVVRPNISKKINHRSPGEILLDWIFDKRKANSKTDFVRFIGASATLTKSYAAYIEEKKWLSEPIIPYSLSPVENVHTSPPTIEQHVLLVSLRQSHKLELVPDGVFITPATLPEVNLHHNIRTNPPKLENPRSESPYPPNYLTIPSMQHLIRKIGARKVLAIIPHGASRADFVWACQYHGLLGVQELRFSMEQVDRGFLEPEPIKGAGATVYVCYPRDVRGVDVKNVDIVFYFGEFGSLEDYVHVIGRTGRRDGRGMVITLLEDSAVGLSQQMTNAAIKILRSGGTRKEWSLPRIEMDLKALPEDKYEDMRTKAGIVAMTEEYVQKRERETRTQREMDKFMGGVEEPSSRVLEPKTEEEELVLRRPRAFDMGIETPGQTQSTIFEPQSLGEAEFETVTSFDPPDLDLETQRKDEPIELSELERPASFGMTSAVEDETTLETSAEASISESGTPASSKKFVPPSTEWLSALTKSLSETRLSGAQNEATVAEVNVPLSATANEPVEVLESSNVQLDAGISPVGDKAPEELRAPELESQASTAAGDATTATEDNMYSDPETSTTTSSEQTETSQKAVVKQPKKPRYQELDTLPPFPDNAPFPVVQVRQTWEEIIKYNQSIKAESSQAPQPEIPGVTIPPETLAKAKEVGEPVLESPRVLSDLKISSTNTEDVKVVLEGENVKQANTAEAVPPKRKRGRPRKNPLPAGIEYRS
jgi:DEAD/DEAH box helicase